MAVAMDTAAGNAPPINYEEYVLSLTLATGAEFPARGLFFLLSSFSSLRFLKDDVLGRWDPAGLDVLCFKG